MQRKIMRKKKENDEMFEREKEENKKIKGKERRTWLCLSLLISYMPCVLHTFKNGREYRKRMDGRGSISAAIP